jgi:hypothetical protein
MTDTIAPPDEMAPGIYQLTAEQYHADPVPGGSLSSSGARKLLPPSCPARFRYEADHGTEPKAHFDIGHAAHKLVLGTGPDLVVVDADSWRTKAAKEAAQEAREAGAVPLLPDDHDQVQAMAAALRQDPLAAALLDPDQGLAEQALIWKDRRTGVMRRALLDWLPEARRGRTIIPDYKTCASAAPDDLAKALYRFGYHQQADWYAAGAQALGLAGDDAAFVFICQEKNPPYLVTVIEPDHIAMRIGKTLNQQAIGIYDWCRRNDTWPGYSDDIVSIALPRWVEAQFEEMAA